MHFNYIEPYELERNCVTRDRNSLG